MFKLALLMLALLQLVSISFQQEDGSMDIRMRFGITSERNINDQIAREFKAMLMYDAMSSYFGRPGVGLPGFHKLFRKAANEEREHAHKLIDYLNKRGGKVAMKSIASNPKFEWETPLDAVKTALAAEKEITSHLYNLRDRAEDENDAHLVDYIESEFLTEQVTGIKELRELAAKLERAGKGVGEYLIDKEL